MNTVGPTLHAYWLVTLPPVAIAAIAGFLLLNAVIGAVTYLTRDELRAVVEHWHMDFKLD